MLAVFKNKHTLPLPTHARVEMTRLNICISIELQNLHPYMLGKKHAGFVENKTLNVLSEVTFWMVRFYKDAASSKYFQWRPIQQIKQ